MAPLSHSVWQLGEEQDVAQLLCCHATAAMRSTRLLPPRFAPSLPKPGGLPPKLAPSLQPPRSRCLQTDAVYLPAATGPGRSFLAFCGCWREGEMLGMVLAGRSHRQRFPTFTCSLPEECAPGRERGRSCFETSAPVLFIWIPQCPWHGSHL